MKDIETMREMLSANREQFFQRRRELEENLATLEKIYGDGLRHDCTPVQTVSAYVEAVGYNDAVEIIASLVNRSAWDGRISAAVKSWAERQETAWNEEACAKLRLYSDRIHMAHLDQIAAAMMEYVPDRTQKAAADFVAAIKEIAGKPQNMANLESYLSRHFGEWLEKFADTPEGIAAEMRAFAKMES